MSAKQGPLNQHEYLHPHYGINDCCLCKAEEKINILEQKLRMLKNFCTQLTTSQYPLDSELQKAVYDKFWENL